MTKYKTAIICFLCAFINLYGVIINNPYSIFAFVFCFCVGIICIYLIKNTKL